jgi:hypothetical protein
MIKAAGDRQALVLALAQAQDQDLDLDHTWIIETSTSHGS